MGSRGGLAVTVANPSIAAEPERVGRVARHFDDDFPAQRYPKGNGYAERDYEEAFRTRDEQAFALRLEPGLVGDPPRAIEEPLGLLVGDIDERDRLIDVAVRATWPSDDRAKSGNERRIELGENP